MALPVKQAADLAKSMASKGLSGSISMGEPADDMEKPAEGEDYMESCLSDLSDAIVSGDKGSIMSCLKELVDHLKAEDEEQDQSLGE